MKAANGTSFRRDVHRLGKGARTLKTDVNSLAHGAVEAARSGVTELRHGAQYAIDSASRTAAGTADSLKGLIARNPVASVSIAAGVGIAIGLFMRRSHR